MSEPADAEVVVAAEVDATGLSCPMPVIELAKQVDALEVGDVVRLLATDPAAKVDVPVWCRMQRQGLRSADEVEGVWAFLVEKRR
ncbi:sulfurtransferase TusA family protein [Nitriliruptoraceae bacterium ZYF776]|nr:sulfurtransferase TusA family protein [Profundirhabdus halotolerans]